jgi:hypothetical protein
MFQADSVKDAAFGCDWVGTPIAFQRCLMFIIATANKEFHLTAGKFVPLSNVTTMNVRNWTWYRVREKIPIIISLYNCTRIVQGIALPQRYSKIADISLWEELNRDRDIKFASSLWAQVTLFRRYLHSNRQEQGQQSASTLSEHCAATAESSVLLR